MKDFKNKVVIVTGASSGIGEAMAREFAAQGARVVLGARSVQKLQLIAGDIRSRGGQAAYCGVDVTDVGECRELIDTAVREFGGIDVLVCNAGLSMRAIFDDVDLEVLHRLMDVNFWGTVNCCKFALPYLQQSHGSIVGISSVAGLHGLPGRTGYSASKYAMTGFLETLRIENLKKGLHVMIACPGFTASNVRFSALTADGTQQGATRFEPRELWHGKKNTPKKRSGASAPGSAVRPLWKTPAGNSRRGMAAWRSCPSCWSSSFAEATAGDGGGSFISLRRSCWSSTAIAWCGVKNRGKW